MPGCETAELTGDADCSESTDGDWFSMRTRVCVPRGAPSGRVVRWACAILVLHALRVAHATAADAPDAALPMATAPAQTATGETPDSAVLSGDPIDYDNVDATAFAGPVVGAATDPRRYFVFDVLGMQRNYAVPDAPLVVENVTPQFTALQTNMLQSTVAPGVRLLYGDYGRDGVGWETGYLGLWNMYATSRVESPDGLLQAPGALGFASPAMRNGAQGAFTGVTSLQSADVNAVVHWFDGGWDPLSPRPSQRVNWYDGGHLDWIAGFRWAGLDDVGILGITPAGGTAPNTYTAHATSNLFAGQAGVRGRLEFQEWALESWIKVGLAGTSISQTQSFQDQLAPLDPFRPTGSSWKGGVGLIADANLSAVWRMDETWGIRLGYNLIWLTGVALAPNQFDWSARTDPSTTLGIDNRSSMLLSGVNAGLEARW